MYTLSQPLHRHTAGRDERETTDLKTEPCACALRPVRSGSHYILHVLARARGLAGRPVWRVHTCTVCVWARVPGERSSRGLCTGHIF